MKKISRGPEPDLLLGRGVLCFSIAQPHLLAPIETPLDWVSAPPLACPVAAGSGWRGTWPSFQT